MYDVDVDPFVSSEAVAPQQQRGLSMDYEAALLGAGKSNNKNRKILSDCDQSFALLMGLSEAV